MTTLASRPLEPAAIVSRARPRVPLWVAVICSRLIVLAAGIYGALASPRVHGWTAFDPHRLSTSLGSVGNVLAASVLRWDGIRYVTIAEHGYTQSAQTVSFPLYSLLIRAVGTIVPSPVVAGVLISLVCFAIALVLVHRIASDELGSRVADITVLMLAFAPLSFFFSAVYTESLMLALTAGTFYFARQQRFAYASIAAAGAALTHVEGILLVAPLALMYWRSRGRTTDLRQLWSRSAASLALPPLAVAGFFTYLHAQGYGWLAPITNANQANYGRTMVGPAVVVYRTIKYAGIGLDQVLHGVKPINPSIGSPFSPGFQNVVYLVVLSIAVLSLISAWRRLPREYSVFAVLVLIVCTASAVQEMPLEAFDRYVLPIFPLWIGAAAWVERQRVTRPLLLFSIVALVFYTVMFARWSFVA
jgi:hypothetical protein